MISRSFGLVYVTFWVVYQISPWTRATVDECHTMPHIHGNKPKTAKTVLSQCITSLSESQSMPELIASTCVRRSEAHHWDFSPIFPWLLDRLWAADARVQVVVVQFLTQSVHADQLHVLPWTVWQPPYRQNNNNNVNKTLSPIWDCSRLLHIGFANELNQM